jgi:hypothetical protein
MRSSSGAPRDRRGARRLEAMRDRWERSHCCVRRDNGAFVLLVVAVAL